jgi:PilZ domain
MDKFQSNALTEPYEVIAKLGEPRYCRGYQPVIFMNVVEPRAKVKRETRRQLHKRLAWITVDNGVSERECHVLDVSSGGARIASDDAMDVRDCFELTLVKGHKRELCEVIWRRGKTYGVKFVTPLSEVTSASDPAEASAQPS